MLLLLLWFSCSASEGSPHTELGAEDAGLEPECVCDGGADSDNVLEVEGEAVRPVGGLTSCCCWPASWRGGVLGRIIVGTGARKRRRVVEDAERREPDCMMRVARLCIGASEEMETIRGRPTARMGIATARAAAVMMLGSRLGVANSNGEEVAEVSSSV